MKNLLNMLHGISGEFELLRVCGAFGIVGYVVSAIVFEGWNMARGHPFDVTAFCLAFSGGLVTAFGGVAGSVALKDRNVATSQVIAATGAVPAKPPAGPPVPVEPAT